MLGNINLTEKQEQVLQGLNKMLERKEYQTIVVSDIYCNMTAVEKIISDRWFDRTFNKLVELGLVKKEDMTVEITGGHRKGEFYESYGYNLTDLGFEYLGITNPNKTEEQNLQDDIQFNIKSAKTRLPKGYDVKVIDGQYCIVNKQGVEVTDIQDIPQSDYTIKNEYVFVTNAFNFVHYANVLLERLFELQPVTQQVVDTPVESKVSRYTNKPEYQIYPENITTLDDVKQVVGIVLNDVLSKKHQQLLLDDIHEGYFKVTFNSRLRTSLGRCCETIRNGKRHIKCIELNPNYIKYEPDNNLKIDTIIHEICHAITDLETDESNMHGPKWQANCIRYGCSPTTKDKIVHYEDVMWNKGLISHRLICVDCNEIVEYKNNPGKGYIHDVMHSYFYHRQCGKNHLILESNPVNNK